MGSVQEVIDYVRSLKGVIGVFEMDGQVSQRIWDSERSVKTLVQTDYCNMGYDDAMRRKHRLCVFFNDDFELTRSATIKLMSSDGTVMGTSVCSEEAEEYRGKDGVIWVSNDFVMFADVYGSGDQSFVLMPYSIPEIERNVPGTCSVIGTSPTTSSDVLLKEIFDEPLVKGIYTTVIAFD